MANSEIMDKLLKIKELSERGYKGEATQAKQILSKMLEKYGLTLSDLEKEFIEEYSISYRSYFEKQLLVQIISVFDLKCYSIRSKRAVFIETTPLNYAEILNMFSFHKKRWKAEANLFLEAYVSKHRLYPPTDSVEFIGEEQELTRAEKYRRYRIANMSEGLDPERYKKKEQNQLSAFFDN